MSVNGYLECCVYEGAVNANTYYAFVEENLLPHCNAFPGPRSIIVMDNASIHRSPVRMLLFLKTQIRNSKISSKAKDASSNSFLRTPQTLIPSNTPLLASNKSSEMENTTWTPRNMRYLRKKSSGRRPKLLFPISVGISIAIVV